MKYLIEIIYIYRFGIRTTGEIISVPYGRGTTYKIKFHVNNEEYICNGEGLNNKWQIGKNVTIIYSQKDPNRSCLEKYDLQASVMLTAGTLFLLIGAIIVEHYALTAV